MQSENSDILTERSGLIVWVSDIKAASRQLDKYGSVHYISKRLQYVAMYVYTNRLDEMIRQLQKLPFVKKVERSFRSEIKTEYNSNVPDKTRFYSM